MTVSGLRYGVALWNKLSSVEPGALLWLRLRDPLGMCPLTLLFFLCVDAYAWGSFGLARVFAMQSFSRRSPFVNTPHLPGLLSLNQLNPYPDRRTSARLWTPEVIVTVLFFVPCGLFFGQVRSTFEISAGSNPFDTLIQGLFVAVAYAVIMSCLHFSLIWSTTREILVWLVASPMADAYNRISGKVSTSFGLQLRSQVPTARELAVSLDTARALVQLAANVTASGQIAELLRSQAGVLARMTARLEQSHADAMNMLEPQRERAVHDAYFRLARQLNRILRELWRLRAQDPKLDELREIIVTKNLVPSGELGLLPTPALLAMAMPRDCLLWMRTAEDFVALRAVTFIYHLLNQMRLLITFALSGSLLLVCAVFSYPWQPHRLLALLAGGLLSISALLALRVLIGLSRNELLQRLGHTATGLRLGFVNQLATYVALPLAVLAARIFPELGEKFASNIEPFLSLFQ